MSSPFTRASGLRSVSRGPIRARSPIRSRYETGASRNSEPSGKTTLTRSNGHVTWALVKTYPPSISMPLPVKAAVRMNATDGDTSAKIWAPDNVAGSGVGVEVGVAVAVAVGVGIGVGGGVGVAVGDGVKVGVGVAVGVRVAVGSGVGVGVAVGTGVEVGLAVASGVKVAVGVAVTVGCGGAGAVGVAVGSGSSPHPNATAANATISGGHVHFVMPILSAACDS